MNESRFTGSMFGLIGVRIVSFFMTLFTLGIGFPWAIAYKQRWVIKNQYIDGKQLIFRGTGAQLFGNYIKWLLLSIITFGIYSLWLPIKIQQWVTKHTHVREYNESEAQYIRSAGNLQQGELLGVNSDEVEKPVNWFNIARVIWIVLGASVLLFVVAMEIAMVARLGFTPALWLLGTSTVFFVLLIIFLFKKQNMGMFLLVLMMAMIKIMYLDFGVLQKYELQVYQIRDILLNSNSLFQDVFKLFYTFIFVHLGLLLFATVFSIIGLFQKAKDQQ